MHTLWQAPRAMAPNLSLVLPNGRTVAYWKANYASLKQLRKYVPLERGTYQISYLGKDRPLSKF